MFRLLLVCVRALLTSGAAAVGCVSGRRRVCSNAAPAVVRSNQTVAGQGGVAAAAAAAAAAACRRIVQLDVRGEWRRAVARARRTCTPRRQRCLLERLLQGGPWVAASV
jgi:hypothetical protein